MGILFKIIDVLFLFIKLNFIYYSIVFVALMDFQALAPLQYSLLHRVTEIFF